MFKRTVALIAALVMAFALAIPSALAATFDTAGNVYSTDDATPSEKEISGDFIWVGLKLAESGLAVGGDILAAGNDVAVSDSKVAGNVRAAGSSINVSGSSVSRNITIAGRSLIVGTGTSAAAVLAAGEEFEFYGKADYLQVYAQTVTIDGKIDGDVRIAAADVQLGDNAAVTGVLYVESPEEPLIASGAKVNELKFTQTDTESFESIAGFSYKQLVTYATMIYLLIILFTAFVIEWLMRNEVQFAVDFFRANPAKYLLSGLVLAILIPVIIIGFMLLIAAFSISIVVLLFAIILMIIALPFTIVSIARLVFPKLNHYLGITIVAAIATALTFIPVATLALYALSGLFTLGFVSRTLLRRIRNNRGNRGGNALGTADSGQFGSNDSEGRF